MAEVAKIAGAIDFQGADSQDRDQSEQGKQRAGFVIEADGKAKAMSLADAQSGAKSKTDAARRAREAKRAKKTQFGSSSAFNRLKTGAVNSTDVREWMVGEMRRRYGSDFVVGTWTIHQKKLAKQLVEQYGAELTEKAVRYFVRNWTAIAETCGFGGQPNINLLWGMRDGIFGDVQTGKAKYGNGGDRRSRMNADEFQGDETEEPKPKKRKLGVL